MAAKTAELHCVGTLQNKTGTKAKISQDVSYAYLAVKIYCDFMTAAKNTSGNCRARDVILELCSTHARYLLEVQLKPNATEEALHQETNQIPSVGPFLVFLGELYLQLIVGGRRLQPIGAAVIDISKALMNADYIPFEQTVLDIFSVMKLTGPSLDEDMPALLNELMMPLSIKISNAKDKISKATYNLVKTLVGLRSQWSTPTTSENESENAELTDDLATSSDMPVMYGPDGKVIGFEEQLFLECPFQTWNLEDKEEPESVSPSMDGEMVSAYEEFVNALIAEESPKTEGEKK